MRLLYQIPLRVRSLFRRRAAEEELSEELRNHLEFQIEHLIAAGMEAEEARRTALREFGGVEQTKEECRDARNIGLVETTLQDLRFGFRMLLRSPGFSLLAVLCLTLGIGANAAVFSWIEGILFRPYPGVANLDKMRVLAGTLRGTPGHDGMSWPDLLDYQRSARLVDAVVAEKLTRTTLSVGDRAEIAVGSMVSANYFDAMGIRIFMGRGFEPADDVGRSAHPVTVISYQMWRDHFHADPNIVGKTQVFNALPFTIVGVTAPGFYGTFVGYPFSFWVPITMQERFDSSYKLEDRGAHWIEPFVRLKPGVTMAQAQAELDAIAARLEREYPDTNRGRGVRLYPVGQSPFNSSGVLLPTLEVSLVVVIFVLLIACANVGNLLLVRSFARRQEMTMRVALGARRLRIVRQLLTEGMILTGVSAVAGLLVANWCRGLLVRVIPPRGVPLRIEGILDWRVVAVSAGICVVSTMLFALMPALDSSNVDLAASLKTDGGAVVGSRRNWVRSALVIVQVSLTFLLLVGAGLLIRSVQRLRSSRPGFDTSGVLLTSVNLFVSGYDLPRAQDFQDRFMDRLQAVPGVQSAAYARIPPFSFKSYSQAPIAVDGYAPPPGQQPVVEYDEISPEFFSTVGIPLITGRDFSRADDARAMTPVAIVNEAMVAQYYRGENPVGRRLKVGDRSLLVVGVARQAKYENPMENDKPFFYVPLRQQPTVEVAILIRTATGPEAMLPAIARQVHSIDPGLAVYAVTTMKEQLQIQTAPQNIALSLLTIFGGMGLLLAAVGIYGVLSCAVSQSTRELGLRMALGATPRRLVRLVVWKGMRMTAAGIVLGGVAALATTRLLGYLLYRVSPRDPLAFLSALAVMTIAGALACAVPAWRATHTDPLKALKG